MSSSPRLRWSLRMQTSVLETSGVLAGHQVAPLCTELPPDLPVFIPSQAIFRITGVPEADLADPFPAAPLDQRIIRYIPVAEVVEDVTITIIAVTCRGDGHDLSPSVKELGFNWLADRGLDRSC